MCYVKPIGTYSCIILSFGRLSIQLAWQKKGSLLFPRSLGLPHTPLSYEHPQVFTKLRANESASINIAFASSVRRTSKQYNSEIHEVIKGRIAQKIEALAFSQRFKLALRH